MCLFVFFENSFFFGTSERRCYATQQTQFGFSRSKTLCVSIRICSIDTSFCCCEPLPALCLYSPSSPERSAFITAHLQTLPCWHHHSTMTGIITQPWKQSTRRVLFSTLRERAKDDLQITFVFCPNDYAFVPLVPPEWELAVFLSISLMVSNSCACKQICTCMYVLVDSLHSALSVLCVRVSAVVLDQLQLARQGLALPRTPCQRFRMTWLRLSRWGFRLFGCVTMLACSSCFSFLSCFSALFTYKRIIMHRN
jgi:hypothetical protein